MGEHNVLTKHDSRQAQAFMKSLLTDVSALQRMIDTGRIESGVRRIGAEQEMFLLDRAMRPAPVSMEVLKNANDHRLTTEIGKFNLEANLSPRPLSGHSLREMEGELSELVAIARRAARGCDAETHLFPALEQIGIPDGNGPLAFLRGEHETERRLLGDLELAVEEYRHDLAASAKFVSVANQYKDHLIEHMRQEEAILFRLAEEMLEGRVKDALTHLFAEENAETQERNRRYEQLAKELEKTWTV